MTIEQLVKNFEEEGYRVEIKDKVLYLDGWAIADIVEESEVIETDNRVLR